MRPATEALLIIDIQNDFCPGGAMAVPEGDAIIPGVAKLAAQFDTVILAQDWHPPGHASFASTHQAAPFSTYAAPYGEQTLWPDHCVQGSTGADFHPDLYATGVVARARRIVRKGTNPAVDSYSAFFENDQVTSTGLGEELKASGITRVVVVGLAYDFCVGFTALDARKLGLDAIVVPDLCRTIAMPMGQGTTVDAIEQRFEQAGVRRLTADALVPASVTSPRRPGRP